MNFTNELQRAFGQFQSMLTDDQNADLLDAAYSEFTLKCYAGYSEFTLKCYAGYSQRLYNTILQENAPLAKAFRAIGVEQPRDQLLILFDSFYLHRRTAEKRMS